MDELIWRWILEHLDNKVLLEIIKESGIKIPGFRKIHVGVVKQMKKKLVLDMVKGSNRVQLHKLFNYLEEGDTACVRQMELETLDQKLKSGELDPCQTFAFLLSSSNEDHCAKARKLFENIPAVMLEELAENFNEEMSEEEQHKIKHKSFSSIEKKLRKSEEKNRELKAQIEKEKNNGLQLRQGLNEEIKNMKQELIKLKQEAGRLNHEKDALFRENQELQATIKHLNEVLVQKEKSLANLMTREGRHDNEPNKRKIALIGDPKNQMILKVPLYHFQIFHPADLQAGSEEAELKQCDEVWLLTYRTPLAQQLYVKRLVEKQKLIEFHSFLEIRNHIRERVSQ